MVSKEVCKFFKSLVEQLKNSSEMLPDTNSNDNADNDSTTTLSTDTRNPIRDIYKLEHSNDSLTHSSDSVSSDRPNGKKEDKADRDNKEENMDRNSDKGDNDSSDGDNKSDTSSVNGKESNNGSDKNSSKEEEEDEDVFDPIKITRGILGAINNKLASGRTNRQHSITSLKNNPNFNINNNHPIQPTEQLVDVNSLMELWVWMSVMYLYYNL